MRVVSIKKNVIEIGMRVRGRLRVRKISCLGHLEDVFERSNVFERFD